MTTSFIGQVGYVKRVEEPKKAALLNSQGQRTIFLEPQRSLIADVLRCLPRNWLEALLCLNANHPAKVLVLSVLRTRQKPPQDTLIRFVEALYGQLTEYQEQLLRTILDNLDLTNEERLTLHIYAAAVTETANESDASAARRALEPIAHKLQMFLSSLPDLGNNETRTPEEMEAWAGDTLAHLGNAIGEIYFSAPALLIVG